MPLIDDSRDRDSQARIRTLEAEVQRLTAAQAATERQVAAMREVLVRPQTGRRSDLEARVSKVEHAVETVREVVDLILESRIWKTLQAGGGVLLQLQEMANKRGIRLGRTAQTRKDTHPIQIHCDTLPPAPVDPFSGLIEIKGWAHAASRVEKVEVTIDGEAAMPTQFSLPRPDTAKLPWRERPDPNCGYSLEFDTRSLTDGMHQVQIRACCADGTSREIEFPLLVNQLAAQRSEYWRWLKVFDPPQPELMRLRVMGLTCHPTISVLVPVFRTKPDILRETIASVRRQSYPHWQLCLVDDGSEHPQLTEVLTEAVSSDRRIVYAAQEQSGISAASNRALELAAGEYVALLDHDDVLADDALFHVADALQSEPRPDLLYSDEDHMDETGRRFSPFFKPDWSPDLILAENYICHLLVFRRELCLRAGGFRSAFDISQDHDILLRMSRHAEKIVHIPKILYHWRTSQISQSRASLAEDRALGSSRAVVESFLRESGVDGSVEEGRYPGRWRVRYAIPKGTRVSILIPSAGKTEILDRNLDSLWTTAGKTPFEVVVIDNCRGENNATLVRYVERLQAKGRPVRRFDQRNEPFNYSFLNNRAAQECDAPLLLFLNDDTEGISDGWLDAMAELAARKEVGAVGAKLLYPDRKIQHAGVTMGLSEICGHSFKGLPGDNRHYYDFPDMIRNVSAVTAACVMMRSEVFQKVNGFDGAAFPIAYNDIDLCLRIGAAGYRILYTPHALLYHYEAYSKSSADYHPHPAETMALKTRWREVIERDPFYNPNLTRRKENWGLRWD